MVYKDIKTSIKEWCKKVFLRDLDITREGFLYFLVAFTFIFTVMDYIVFSLITFKPIELISVLGVIASSTTLLILIFSGIIVDQIKNRMRLLIISAFLTLFGLFLTQFEDYIKVIGINIMFFGGGIFLIDLFTILIHESTILNRGRLTGYLLFFSYVIAHTMLFLSMINLNILLIFEGFLLLLLFNIYHKYSYIETDERLKSEYRFREIITKNQPVLGYFIAFMVLGFIFGNAFPVEMTNLSIDPLPFVLLSLSFLIITGTFLDNMGRKWTFTAGILVISTLIIFAGIFKEIYRIVFFGISIPITFTLLLTFSGDFATERNTIKYRGRITAFFLLSVIGGFVSGVLLRFYTFNIVYNSDPNFWYWIPSFINGVNSLLLIILLVWIMPLPEILSAKEADWAKSLRNIYVFNKDSICLFTKSYLCEEDMLNLPSEDLITGGLTGILTLISEITNEKKNLRIIDKERVKIYFSYGKNIIVALISTKYLPILFKKLEQFTKAFEKEFEAELNTFTGKINVFQERTEALVEKYFK
ncbi:MAG: hypothetical protein ACTSQS_01415 [Promethearchaeota archaeon]